MESTENNIQFEQIDLLDLRGYGFESGRVYWEYATIIKFNLKFMSIGTAETNTGGTGGIGAELSVMAELDAGGWEPIELFGRSGVIWRWGDTNYRKLVRPGCPVFYYQRRPDWGGSHTSIIIGVYWSV